MVYIIIEYFLALAKNELKLAALPVLKGNVKIESGYMKQFTHWSDACQCEMTFSIFLPERKQRLDADPPVLYYLSGMFHKGVFSKPSGNCIVAPNLCVLS